MASNITNIIVNVFPDPRPPTSAQSSPSPSASGTNRSMGQQLVASPGFWALMIVVAGCLAGAGYFFWRRPASKSVDIEGTPLKDISVGEQPKQTSEEIHTVDDVEAHPPLVTPKTPEACAPSTTPKKKKRLSSGEMASLSTLARNTTHGMKEGMKEGLGVQLTGIVC
ncbi:uncharacterized protein N7518_005863 [Penicillium psychrosexuale]|uniref:uncharacterized protein n=1 Tax=Penicillium psychrosexuale TaxID=1002107 RepID=UPI0025451662|nr:uncharacterized protein N7518_005863 [Penicillium psychrosexuale]KAJ5788852.1 hypothetical protein N7518_005863 [Penicillium psychrosexuale]